MSNLSPAAVLHNTSSVEVGTASTPLRTDPTGTTAQPVTDNGGSLTIDATALPLPTGAATETTLALIKAKTDNLDVALSTRAVTGLTDAQLRATAVPISATQLPAALVGGRLDENVGAWLGSTAPTVGRKVMADSLPVTMASDQPAIPVTFAAVNSRSGVSGSSLTLGGATANTLNVMRTTVYTEPAAVAQRSIASSNANDTAAGTGARTVRLTYFDNTGAGPLTEVVTLNGVTPVNTVATNIRFIESLEVVTIGSVGANVGTITLYGSTAGGGGTVGTIGIGNIVTLIGDNRTLWAHHYVATGYRAELAVLSVGVQSGGSPTSAKFFVRSAQPLVANGAEVVVGDIVLVQGTYLRAFDFHPLITGFSRLTAYGVPGVNNTTITAAFDWQEVAT